MGGDLPTGGRQPIRLVGVTRSLKGGTGLQGKRWKAGRKSKGLRREFRWVDSVLVDLREKKEGDCSPLKIKSDRPLLGRGESSCKPRTNWKCILRKPSERDLKARWAGGYSGRGQSSGQVEGGNVRTITGREKA